MNKFLIITNYTKDDGSIMTSRIRDYLLTKGKECILPRVDEEGLIIPESIPPDADCAIVLGGDGTLIRASGALVSFGTPILGVNMGTLGYLTEVEVHNVESAIDQLLDGDYFIEERMMLYGNLAGKKRQIALNDIVVSRSGTLRIVNFNLYVNGEFLNAYQADGIIISTPTGSTAYNLSAGGPIIEPTASMILITPICSHALNKGSIVFSSEDEIVIELGTGRTGEPDEAVVSFDGSAITPIYSGDRVTIKKARETAKLVKLSKISFLETLRAKMKGN